MKKEAKYLPVSSFDLLLNFLVFQFTLYTLLKFTTSLSQIIGWSMWFSDYIFLERSWAKDENTLKVNFCVVSFLSLNLVMF